MSSLKSILSRLDSRLSEVVALASGVAKNKSQTPAVRRSAGVIVKRAISANRRVIRIGEIATDKKPVAKKPAKKPAKK